MLDNPTPQRRKTDMPVEILEKDLTDTQKLAVNLVSLNTAVNVLQEDSAKYKHILIEGNGELPLMERVRNMEAFITSTKFWLRTIAVAVVLQTITFGTAAIVYFAKLYPLLEKISKLP